VSPTTGRARKLPVDGYWPTLGLVVEFQEKQHSEAVPLFDRRATVSGVPRGEQRRLYDRRKAGSCRSRPSGSSSSTSRSSRRPDKIVRDHERDIAVLRARLV
jgi:hypothetical protein